MAYHDDSTVHTIMDHAYLKARMWANVMAALPNTGGALCSTPHSLADAHNQCRAVTLPIRETH